MVDRDRDLADRLSSLFRQYALTMDHASDAVEARRLLEERDYDVVMIDLLTESNLEALLGSTSTRSVVLAFTSDHHQLPTPLDSQRIAGVIRKPFDLRELGSVVRACVDIRVRRSLDTMAAMLASGSLLSAVLG